VDANVATKNRKQVDIESGAGCGKKRGVAERGVFSNFEPADLDPNTPSCAGADLIYLDRPLQFLTDESEDARLITFDQRVQVVDGKPREQGDDHPR